MGLLVDLVVEFELIWGRRGRVSYEFLGVGGGMGLFLKWGNGLVRIG